MRLLPALRINGEIIKGDEKDSHDTLKQSHGIPLDQPDDKVHGFTPDGKLWLSRRAALGWLQKYEPAIYAKVIKKAPDDGLHSQDYAEAKGIKQRELKEEKIDLSTKTVIIYDRGVYTYLAEFLAPFFGKVQYYKAGSDLYPQGAPCKVGKGIPGVEWVADFEKAVEKADFSFFPYVFDGGKQALLRKNGYPVCGSGRSEKIEHDKWFFKKKLKEVGLSVVPTYRAEGLDDLEKFLKDKPPKRVIKSSEPYRGDWETHIYKNRYELQCYINTVRGDVGPVRAKEMQLLVEKWIEAACESGCDGMRLRGKLADWPTVGMETKDSGYISHAVEKLPDIIQKTEDALAPVYEEMGDYAGPYSNEMRITESGIVYRTDETCRGGNPATPCFIEMFQEQYARAIYDLAMGKLPKMKKPKWEYGAEIVLESPWYIKHELHVDCPKDFGPWLKLNNMYMDRGQRYCDPILAQDDVTYFGSVVGFGNSLKAATEMATEKIKEVYALKLHYSENVFDECKEACEAGKRFGIFI